MNNVNVKTDDVWDYVKQVSPPNPRPELNVIVDRLQEAISQYERISIIVNEKLDCIQTRRGGSLKINNQMGRESIGTLLGAINDLIDRLDGVNSMMLDNIEHLNEIV